jgi:predicted transcriptional regulator
LKRSEHYENYPPSVSEITEKLLESLTEEKFFEEEQADYDITFKRFADSALSKWVKGNDIEDFSEEEFSSILRYSIVESDLVRLNKKGLLDSMEDENGETVYFLTEKGKNEMSNL